jgi:hypothetical protein
VTGIRIFITETTYLVWTDNATNREFVIYTGEDGPAAKTRQHAVDFYNDNLLAKPS